ncbi:MAG TPA: GTP 3',8-cyclase MoaA [Nitrososphaeraceae archaeon]
MLDSFGRHARKLRISVTDRCNMRCMYCMPQNDKIAWYPENDFLTYEEIVRLAGIFSTVGVEKIRITGGEPLVRPNIEKLIRALSCLQSLKQISLTTNGLLLREKLIDLKDAGLQSINISLDTLVADRFKTITGIDGFAKVLNSIYATVDSGLNTKINVVIMRGWNDDEIEKFVDFGRTNGIVIRFIEFMPLDGSHIWDPSLVVPMQEILMRIERTTGDLKVSDSNSSDPAQIYSLENGGGIIGFIPSMSKPFCGSCDRVRITSDGKFLTCLFEKPLYDLKPLLRNGKTDLEIRKYIEECFYKKSEGVIAIIRNNNLKPGMNLMHTIGG